MDQEDNQSLFHYKLTPGTGFLITLLVLALIALSERILYDLGRTFAPGPLDYFDNLSVIFIHAFFIIPLLAISIMVNVFVGEKKQKYAIVIIPYFVTTIALSIQLILQVAVYFANHHNDFQLYVVLIALIAVCSYAIYEIQRRFQPKGP